MPTMRGYLVLVAALSIAAPLAAQSTDGRVEALLRQMTLEEKVGEMTQIDISVVTKVAATATRPMQIDSAKLEEIVVNRNVGSLLNVPGVALKPAQWVELTGMVQRFAARRRLPIPVLYGIDAVHGHQYMLGGTIFPQNIAMAATWNPALMRRAAEITAYEVRASGIGWNFAPVLDVARQPLWSRFYETFGEDPYLASVFGAAAVESAQRDPESMIAALIEGKPVPLLGNVSPVRSANELYVAATAKHFLGYGAPLSGHDRTTAWIPDRQLRELYLPPFRAAIDAGLRSVMVNSGDINGVPVHANREILTDLLRTELGFRGVVVSDWEDIIRLQTVAHVARSRREAVRMAIEAGIDVSMVPYSTSFEDDLIALVHSGEITEARIDQSVRRILALKVDLGLFERPGPDAAKLAKADSPAFRNISRRSAEEAITLVKNERGVLPLSRDKHILVTGPGATSVAAQHGGWTYTWQGADTAMYPKSVQTFLAAMRTQFGPAQVDYAPGTSFASEIDISAAITAARRADVIVVALAEAPSAEKPGDIDDLALPSAQLRLAHAMERTGKPVIVTLFAARPRTLRDVVDSASAILLAYQTGPYGGEATARVLGGAVNPSGHLPFTYPRNSAAIEHYDHAAAAEIGPDKPDNGYNPEWDFGFGLSYTAFTYDSLRVARATVGIRDTVVISVVVANTGNRDGMEVVQVYSRQHYASVSPPVKKLRAFEKIALAAGERRTVRFRIPVQRLAFVGRDNRLGVEPGEFTLMIGGRNVTVTVE